MSKFANMFTRVFECEEIGGLHDTLFITIDNVALHINHAVNLHHIHHENK